jgi:hypothetical protein
MHWLIILFKRDKRKAKSDNIKEIEEELQKEQKVEIINNKI